MAALLCQAEIKPVSNIIRGSTPKHAVPVTIYRINVEEDPYLFETVACARGEAYRMHSITNSADRIDMQVYRELEAKLKSINGHESQAHDVPYRDNFDFPNLSTTLVACSTRDLDMGTSPERCLLGTMRAVHGSQEHQLDVHHLMTNLPPELMVNPETCTEIGRFALFDTRDAQITRLLYNQATIIAAEKKQSDIYAIMPTFVRRHARKAGVLSQSIPGTPNYDSKALLELIVEFPGYWLNNPRLYKLSTE